MLLQKKRRAIISDTEKIIDLNPDDVHAKCVSLFIANDELKKDKKKQQVLIDQLENTVNELKLKNAMLAKILRSKSSTNNEVIEDLIENEKIGEKEKEGSHFEKISKKVFDEEFLKNFN